jgi:hypothetical protein
MKRLLIGAVMAAVLAVAGCGVAQGSAAHGTGGGGAAHNRGSHAASAGKNALPVLTASQVAAGHLVSRPWTLVRITHGGTVAEIRYSFGGCQPRPRGVLVTQSPASVTLALEAPRLPPGTVCTPDLRVATAQVHLPALTSQELHHAHTSH